MILVTASDVSMVIKTCDGIKGLANGGEGLGAAGLLAGALVSGEGLASAGEALSGVGLLAEALAVEGAATGEKTAARGLDDREGSIAGETSTDGGPAVAGEILIVDGEGVTIGVMIGL